MIKAKATTDKGPLYVFGLSDANIKLLRDRKLIAIDLAEMDGVGRVLICWGESEAQLAADLYEFVGPQTKIHGSFSEGE